MAYTHDTFLLLNSSDEKNIYIVDVSNTIKYTINPYLVVNCYVSNNLLKISLKTGKSINIPFSTNNESKMALKRIKLNIDIANLNTTSKNYYVFGHPTMDPMDSTTYYMGTSIDMLPGTEESDFYKIQSQFNGLVKKVSIITYINSQVGSDESQTFLIKNYTTGEERLITNSYKNLDYISQKTYLLSDFIFIKMDDMIGIKWVNPTYSNPPISVLHKIYVYFE